MYLRELVRIVYFAIKFLVVSSEKDFNNVMGKYIMFLSKSKTFTEQTKKQMLLDMYNDTEFQSLLSEENRHLLLSVINSSK